MIFIYVNLESDLCIVNWNLCYPNKTEFIPQNPVILLPAGGKITVTLPNDTLTVYASAEIGFAGSHYSQKLVFTRIQ